MTQLTVHATVSAVPSCKLRKSCCCACNAASGEGFVLCMLWTVLLQKNEP